MDVDRLFVHTLRDLEQRTTSTDEYTVLMSAALLRKLLLDKDRLIAQANRNHKLALRFRFSGISTYEQQIYDQEPMFWAITDALAPDGPFAYRPLDGTIDQFLKRRVMRFADTWISVRDVIHHLANIEGAVHTGKAKDDRHRAFRPWKDSITRLDCLVL